MTSPAAVRQRRYRHRQRWGECVVQVELSALHIDWLTVGGWMNDEDATDVSKCSAAVKRVLDVLAKKPLRVTPIRRKGE